MKFKLLEMTRWRGGEYSSNNLGKHLARVPLKIRFAYIAVEIDKIREGLGK